MPELDPVPPGKIALAASWFRSIRDRIEAIKPLEGTGIQIRETIKGHVVSIEAKIYTLNVCKNGLPSTIKVFGPKDGMSEYDKSFLD